MPEETRRQHEQHARQAAARLKRNLDQLLDDLKHNRPLSVDGWQIALDGMTLYGQLTALCAHEELAARTKQAA